MINTEGLKIYSVGELNREIKVILNDSYPDVWVQGEISNFKAYPSGHYYFSLKDSEGQVSAVIFNGAQRCSRFALEDGLQVLARGKIDVYPPRGNYQFIISMVEPAGKGALQLAFEQLKAKLEKEGLFDAARKRAIPSLPHKIGIVTSPTGAAIQDILTVINRRFANVEILIYPARVQGEEAKHEIADGIEYLNTHYADIDVLLVGRGGGALEDLWAFNEEIVARAIAASRIPVISCVGHEIDFTIADFVADLRAPTPSAAAELVVKNKAEIGHTVQHLTQRLTQAMRTTVQQIDNRITAARNSRSLIRPHEIFEERMQRLDQSLQAMIQKQNLRVERGMHRLNMVAGKLHILSPLSTLSRGYSIVRTTDGTIVQNTGTLERGSTISLTFARGTASATITTIDPTGGIPHGKKTEL